MVAHAAKERALTARERMGELARRARRGRGRGNEPRFASAQALDGLGAGWYRLDDIRWPGRSFADIDHVLVGPPGVFVIDTREWSDEISLERAPRGGGQTSVVDGLVMAAHAVGSLLGMANKRPMPILCFAGDAPIDTSADAVRVTSTATIVSTLHELPPTLDAVQVAVVADLIRQRLIPATGLGAIPRQRTS